MDFKSFVNSLKKKPRSGKKYIRVTAKSYISLFLVITLAVGAAYAWFTQLSTTSLTTDSYSMSGASGMRNDKSKKSIDEVKINAFKLEEASSVDGRNIFFPTSMYNNASDKNSSNVNTVTSGIVYREANAGDKTERYAYAQAELSGSSNNTKVWIRGYTVKISDDQAGTTNVKTYQDKLEISSNWDQQIVYEDCPVRIAIISDSGDDAKVFDPSAIVKDYVINSNSVYYISEEGVPTTQYSDLDSFSSYYYGSNNPLFVLNKDETKTISVVAWLEGSHPNAKNFEGKWLSVDLEIETNVSDMGLIYFHDYTSGDGDNCPADNYSYNYTTTKDNYRYAADSLVGMVDHQPSGHWISNDNAIVAVSYVDTLANNVTKTTVMHRLPRGQTSDDGVVTAVDDYTYCAAIPTYVTTDITFFRLAAFDDYLGDPTHILKGNVYNAWHTSSNAPYTTGTPQLTATAQTWQTNMKGSASSFNMSDSRTIGGKTYWHYFAIRGNGYGEVDSTLGNNNEVAVKYERWLAPCIGYWGTNEGVIYDANGTSGTGNP